MSFPYNYSRAVQAILNRKVSRGEMNEALAELGTSLPASETAKGVVELATNAETLAGTDTARAVHPAGLQAKIDALVAAAPGLLNTLDEIAAALNDDPAFATTITNALAGKLPAGQAVWKPGDNNLLAANYNPAAATYALAIPINGFGIFMRVKVPAGTIITNIVTYVRVVASGLTYAAAGVFEADGTRSGLTGSLISTWQGSTGVKVSPLATPIPAQSTDRFVWVCLSAASGTGPVMPLATAYYEQSAAGLSAAGLVAGYIAAAPIPASVTLSSLTIWYNAWVGLS